MRITEFHAGSSELKALVREFRSHALDLLDLLDSKLPIVAKLKVSLEWAYDETANIILIAVCFEIS